MFLVRPPHQLQACINTLQNMEEKFATCWIQIGPDNTQSNVGISFQHSKCCTRHHSTVFENVTIRDGLYVRHKLRRKWTNGDFECE